MKMNLCIYLGVLLIASCQQGVGVEPNTRLQQAQVLSLKDYRGTYLRERADSRTHVVRCELISRQEAGRRFPRVATELTEDEYIYINISRLQPHEVGGSAYYLVDARTGRIINRYHTK